MAASGSDKFGAPISADGPERLYASHTAWSSRCPLACLSSTMQKHQSHGSLQKWEQPGTQLVLRFGCHDRRSVPTVSWPGPEGATPVVRA